MSISFTCTCFADSEGTNVFLPLWQSLIFTWNGTLVVIHRALCHCCSLILLPSSETLPIGPRSCSRAAAACVPWGLSFPFPPSIRDSLQNQKQDDFKMLLIVDDNFIMLFLRQSLLSAELSQLTRPKSSRTFWCQKKLKANRHGSWLLSSTAGPLAAQQYQIT